MQKNFSLGAIVTAFIFISLSASTAALAERRLALVIGNGDYKHAAPLTNPANDAQAMANKLEGLGFETYVGIDLDKFGMQSLLRDYARAARKSDVNIFFYAGHGMSVDGVNYLIPVDAVFEDETALDFEAIEVDFVTRQMSVANAVNLVFLDACRDNPLSKQLSRSMGTTRSSMVSSGLAEMKISNPGKGMAIAFATSPGEVALDGDGVNSPFTTALLNHLDAENTDIAEVFTRVTGDVYTSTNQAQRPWLNVSLTGPVLLNPVTRVQPEVTATNVAIAPNAATTQNSASSLPMLEEQKLLFDLARETGDIEDYRAYLESFPKGLYANNARRTIRRLEQEKGGGTQIVASRTSAAARVDSGAAAAISEVGPLSLPVTASLRNLPANAGTEAGMEIDRSLRGNIQARLNATGNNVGVVDGKWGPKTRRGISAWQATNGLASTGFLNRQQYLLLVSQTDGRFTPYIAPTAQQSSSSGRRKNSGNGDALGAALLGAALGAMLSK